MESHHHNKEVNARELHVLNHSVVKSDSQFFTILISIARDASEISSTESHNRGSEHSESTYRKPLTE